MKIKNKIAILYLAIISTFLFSTCERNELYNNTKNDILSFIDNETSPSTPPVFMHYLVVLGSNNRTSIYDPETNTFSAGPTLPFNTSTGGHSFLITSGLLAGQRIVVHGGVTGNTSFFDPSTLTFSPGPVISGGVNWGGNSFEITSGFYNLHRIVVLGNGSFSVSRFDPVSISFFDDGWLLAGGPGANNGSLNFSISGGRTFVMHGNNSQQTSIFDPATISFTSGPNVMTAPVSGGSQVFPITGGPEVGNLMVMLGNGTWWMNIFNTASNIFTSANLVLAGGGPGTGANNFRIPSGANAGDQVIIIGNGSNSVAIFYQSTNTFALGPSLSGPAFQGSTSFYITDGVQAGKVLVIHGGDTNLTSIYDPVSNTFIAGPNLSHNAGWGTDVFPL